MIAMIMPFAVCMAACDGLRLTPTSADRESSKALDGVKLISRGITDGNESGTYLQSTYQVSESERLLVRFEALGDFVGKITTDSPVRLRFYVGGNAEAMASARTSLRVCPLARNWMMAATWDYAHPFKSGHWARSGGDFFEEECLTADPALSVPATEASVEMTASEKPTLGDDCATGRALCFTVTSWFDSYVAGQGKNYGLILINTGSEPVRVTGDAAGTRSPRILWTQAIK